MAFQTGSRVRPELADADLSGFAKAGEYYGAALANIGAKIGKGIEKHNENKKKKADDKATVDFLRATGAFPNMSDEQIAAGVKGAGGGSQLIADYSNVTAMARAEELQGAKVTAAELANIRSQQSIDFNTEYQPLQLEMTQGQIDSMTRKEQEAIEKFPVNMELLSGQVTRQDQQIAQADVMNPLAAEQATASIASTEQGTAASKAGVTMAEKKMALSETLAKQTQEQNERDYNLKVEELRLKIRAAAQRDPVSAKKLEGAQTYLDDNDLIMVDGAVYEKTGWFGGKAVEVMNPAVLNIEGMEDLRRISMNMQSGFSNAASGNYEGYSMQTEGEDGQPVASDSAVSAAALDSVVQPRPEGSRIGRGMEQGATAIYESAENVYDAGMDFGRGAKSLPFAAYDYLFNPSSPSFDESKARARGVTAPFLQ